MWRIAGMAALAGAIATAMALFMLPGFGGTRIAPIETVNADGSHSETLHFLLPEDGIAVTHGGRVPFPAAPPGVPTFTEDALKRGFALLVRVRDAEGRVVGLAGTVELRLQRSAQ